MITARDVLAFETGELPWAGDQSAWLILFPDPVRTVEQPAQPVVYRTADVG